MIARGHAPGMAHFRRFGPLAYRLALAMLGDEQAAAEAMEAVFAGFGRDGAQWPQWHVALEAMHHHCINLLRDRRYSASPDASPPAFGRDEEGVWIPAATIHDALSELAESDQDLLWDTLLGTNGNSELEPLSDALRRLEIAIRNQDIPTEGDLDWRE